MPESMEFNTFKAQFTKYINNNQTNLLIVSDIHDMDWDDYYDGFQGGASFNSILDSIIKEVYPDGL